MIDDRRSKSEGLVNDETTQAEGEARVQGALARDSKRGVCNSAFLVEAHSGKKSQSTVAGQRFRQV